MTDRSKSVKRSLKMAVAAAVPCCFGALALTAQAVVTVDWQPPLASDPTPGSVSWEVGTNWSTAGVFGTLPTSADIVRFNQTAFNFQPTLGSASATNANVAGIEVGDGTTAAAAVTLTASGGATTLSSLTIGANGITKFANSAGAAAFNTPMALSASQIWTNNSTTLLSQTTGTFNIGANDLTVTGSGNTTISGNLIGSGGITMTGSGTLTIGAATGNFGYSGTVKIKSGSLYVAQGVNNFPTGASGPMNGAFNLGTGLTELGDTSGSNNATLMLQPNNLTPLVANLKVNAGSSGVLTLTPATVSTACAWAGAIQLDHDLVLDPRNGQIVLYTPLAQTWNGTNGTSGIPVSATFLGTGITGSKDLIVNSTGTGTVTIDGGIGLFAGAVSGLGNPNFTGNVIIKKGFLRENNAGGYAPMRQVLGRANTVFVGKAGCLDWRNNMNTIGGLADLTGTGSIDLDGGGTVANSTNSVKGSRTVNIGGSGNYAFSGTIQNGPGLGDLGLSILMDGGGVQTMSGVSPYTGPTNLMRGTLSINTLGNGSVNSAMGAAGAAATYLNFMGGTLKYTGDTTSTDRLLTVYAGGGAIDASGTGSLNFAGTGSITVSDTGVTNSATVTSGSPTIFISAGLFNDLAVGMPISGAGIPDGTTIASLDFELHKATLTNNATASGTGVALTLGIVDRTFTFAGANTAENTFSPILVDSVGGGKLNVEKSGAGKWVLNGANTYIGSTTVKAGKLVLASAAQTPVLSGAGGAVVNGGRLILDYVGGSTPADTVKGLLATAYPSNFASGQIRTTNTPDSAKGIGWADDTTAQQVTTAYTYYGDANLDGQVDISDLGALATAWQTSAVWSQGDFDYSGFVDISDLGKLATNWQLGVGAPLGPSFDQALASVGLAGVSVPEPAMIGLLGLSLAGISTRRFRRGTAAAKRA